MTPGSFEQIIVTSGASHPLALLVVVLAALAATALLVRLGSHEVRP